MTKRQYDIERYLNGAMTPAERHALEKEALSDPFLSDALEGAQDLGTDPFLFDLRQLQSSVANRTGKRRPKIISMWNWSIGIAAALMLIGVVGVFLMANVNEKREMRAENLEGVDMAAFVGENKVDTLEIIMPYVSPASVSNVRRIERVAVAGKTRSITEREVEVNLTDPAEIQIEHTAEENNSRPLAQALTINPRVVRGIVTSAEDGSALPGVNVIVKGTSIGTITDSDGRYEITLNQPDQKLEFKFIGVKSLEAETRNKSSVNVSLSQDYESLSEVVVTGAAVDEPENRTYNFAGPQGGRDAYSKYLQQKLIYPKQALANEVEGRVTIQFTVDQDGKLSNFKVLNSIGFGCDDEAIRLIREGPAWLPSKRNNKPIAEEVKVGLKFDIPGKN